MLPVSVRMSGGGEGIVAHELLMGLCHVKADDAH